MPVEFSQQRIVTVSKTIRRIEQDTSSRNEACELMFNTVIEKQKPLDEYEKLYL